MLGTTVTNDPAALAASFAQWWALAGVDVAVQDMPRDWLSKAQPAPVQVSHAIAAPATAFQPAETSLPPEMAPVQRPQSDAPPAPMPDDLDGFMAWLAQTEQPEAAFSATPILPILPADIALADLVVVTDMPTAEDMMAGKLFSSPEHGLLQAMLRALGAGMEQSVIASLLLARPAGGIIDDALAQRAAKRLRHFIRLTNARTVLLLGDRISRAFQVTSGTEQSEFTPDVNLDDGRISSIPLPAPFVLLKYPERKAAAWEQLRHLAVRR